MARNQLLSKYNFGNDPSFLTLSQCVTQIHKTIVQTRMQPIGALFDRCERLVRDLSRQLGKEVELEVTGGDLELDRSVLEAFADPLTHLIRNALDHGLETAAARQAAGKPPAGLLKISSREQAGEVILAVEDDGRGINAEIIREKCISRGVISAERAAVLSPREILDFIFQPGFSTKDEVTNLSGRGVGLDVVRMNLEALGGVVTVQSTPGHGTAFLARLPLTQALVSSSLISALIVACGGHRYAIPQTAVDEIIKVEPRGDRDDLRLLNGKMVYQLRELALPVVALAQVLGDESGASAQPRTLVVMQFRGQLFGLLVDTVIGVEEIVVRPLPALVKKCKVFSGHTIMGDGQVALILDSHGIIDKQRLDFVESQSIAPLIAAGAGELTDGQQRLVVFSYADCEHFAIPLEMVSLIEKVPLSAIRRIGPHEFIQVKQRTLPLMRLDKVMAVGGLPELTDAYLLVPTRVSYPIAVLAGRSIEVVEAVTHYEAQLSDGQGMLGTFVQGGRLVVLLDLYKLFEKHSPNRFSVASVDQRAAHILLAEDSPFFQNLFRSYLDRPPRRMTVVGDGEAALALLRARPTEFDLVLSDIEMPKMDGHELIKQIRLDKSLQKLPVIAVTSKSSPEDVDRGLKEGFDSYLIKVDKDQLISTIARHLQHKI
jgi:two-component system chemotaxis sensor kinase CheA